MKIHLFFNVQCVIELRAAVHDYAHTSCWSRLSACYETNVSFFSVFNLFALLMQIHYNVQSYKERAMTTIILGYNKYTLVCYTTKFMNEWVIKKSIFNFAHTKTCHIGTN